MWWTLWLHLLLEALCCFLPLVCKSSQRAGIAKVCFAQCSTSRLALGSRGCRSLVVTMPKISLKTLYCYIFEKPKVQGHQNWYSQLSNTQIHKYKYKYTNTALLKCQEYQTYALFLNSCWFKDVKNDIPKCPTVKYTNTQIQIQIHKYKYTNTALLKCQEYQTYAIFLNSCWFKDVKNDNPKCPKSDCWRQTFALSPEVYYC